MALLPDWRVGFQDMLIGSIESVARDLDQLKRDKPLVFARGAQMLHRVVSRYDATAVDRVRAKLDASSGVLTLTGPATRWGVERGETAEALEDEYTRWESGRFAAVRAQDVPAAERRSYFEFLTNRTRSRLRPARAARAGPGRRHRRRRPLRRSSAAPIRRSRPMFARGSWAP